jgi:hypothetical protein
MITKEAIHYEKRQNMKKRFTYLNRRMAAALLALLFGVFLWAAPLPVWAAEQPEIIAFIRIESCVPNNENTLLSLTEVTAPEGATVLDVLDAATESGYTADISDYGAFITSILDVGDDTGQHSWMYTVNDSLAMESADAYVLNNNDEIVFYFIDWQLADYAYFSPAEISAAPGETFTLTLTGIDFAEGEYPVAGAQVSVISIETEETAEEAYSTDAEGRVEIKLEPPALYYISAKLSDENGVPVISRPLCAAEITASETDETVENEPAEATAATATYNAETGELTWEDQRKALPGNVHITDEDGTVFLPVRALAEALGADVSWDAESGTATVTYGAVSFNLVSNGQDSLFPVKLADDRMYIPMAYLSELLGVSLNIIGQ